MAPGPSNTRKLIRSFISIRLRACARHKLCSRVPNLFLPEPKGLLGAFHIGRLQIVWTYLPRPLLIRRRKLTIL